MIDKSIHPAIQSFPENDASQNQYLTEYDRLYDVLPLIEQHICRRIINRIKHFQRRILQREIFIDIQFDARSTIFPEPLLYFWLALAVAIPVIKLRVASLSG